MVVLDIDSPAPAKQSVVFDGKQFQHFTPKEFKEYIDTSDDELNAFACWLMVESDKKIRIYGDSKRGSFLLPYDKTIYESFERF